ncbi:MAG: hypothetical protein KAQ75_06920 [Bacteroidales bacterium]|nr:hypothetical protein [Bacteroidales bacterium]
MNRYILFVFIILVSGIYLQGMQLTENYLQENVIINDSSYASWKESLADRKFN